MRGGERLAAYGRAWRRTWRGRLLSVLLLVPVLWLSVLLLRVPAGYALTVPALLLDRVVLVSTAVVLPVAVVSLLVLPTPGARAAATVGGAVSSIVGLPTLLAALDPPRKPLPTVLAGASVVCGLALVGILLRTSLTRRRWSLSFLAPLAVLPAIQFWQATSYTPSQLITSVTPEVRVAVQAVDAAERRGIIEVTTANLGDVRASLFRAQLVHCFVTEDQFGLSRADLGSLRANGDCAEEPVFFRNAQIDAKTTQTWATVWRAPRDRSLAILAVESYYVRGDRMRLEDATREQDAAPGCQGAVTTYRLQPDTRFKGVVQPARLLTYDQASFYLGYEGAGLCDAENDRELVSELGVRFITVRRSDWLGDEVRPD